MEKDQEQPLLEEGDVVKVYEHQQQHQQRQHVHPIVCVCTRIPCVCA